MITFMFFIYYNIRRRTAQLCSGCKITPSVRLVPLIVGIYFIALDAKVVLLKRVKYGVNLFRIMASLDKRKRNELNEGIQTYTCICFSNTTVLTVYSTSLDTVKRSKPTHGAKTAKSAAASPISNIPTHKAIETEVSPSKESSEE